MYCQLVLCAGGQAALGPLGFGKASSTSRVTLPHLDPRLDFPITTCISISISPLYTHDLSFFTSPPSTVNNFDNLCAHLALFSQVTYRFFTSSLLHFFLFPLLFAPHRIASTHVIATQLNQSPPQLPPTCTPRCHSTLKSPTHLLATDLTTSRPRNLAN